MPLVDLPEVQMVERCARECSAWTRRGEAGDGMSGEPALEDAVDDAIRAVMADQNPGSIVTGWALVISSVDPRWAGSTVYAYPTAQDQPIHTTIGLLAMGDNAHRREIGNGDDE